MRYDTLNNLSRLRTDLHSHLFDQIMPFWVQHAFDDAGGLNTCIDDSGKVISRDKWLWSQWRSVWVFSKLFNDFGQDPLWLGKARHVYDFATQHGWDDAQQAWRLCITGEGAEIRGYESIYVDGFALYGLTEFARATSDPDAIQWACQTADSLIERLKLPHDVTPHFPYPIPSGARVHGIPMILSLVFWELGQYLDRQDYRDVALDLSGQVMNTFYRPDRDVVLERIAADGSELPAPLGTAVVPGHVIESMWFQIHIARDQQDNATVSKACNLIRRHLELGWDETHGGLLLGVDAQGASEVGWDHADTKLWWPQVEALYATLLAHELTGEPWCMQWYQRVHDYAFAHYPVAEHGEWTQRLDRLGQPITEVVALPVKDPFHLPRALILAIQSLDRILEQ